MFKVVCVFELFIFQIILLLFALDLMSDNIGFLKAGPKESFRDMSFQSLFSCSLHVSKQIVFEQKFLVQLSMSVHYSCEISDLQTTSSNTSLNKVLHVIIEVMGLSRI
jgi:hypothetical protein